LARLFADENFPLATVSELRRLGHDILTVAEAGKANQKTPDPQILSIAVRLNRAVLTENRRHFILLHRKHPDHAGIVVCSCDRDFGRQARRIHEVLISEIHLAGALLRVNVG
jgi:hypothetical protein